MKAGRSPWREYCSRACAIQTVLIKLQVSRYHSFHFAPFLTVPPIPMNSGSVGGQRVPAAPSVALDLSGIRCVSATANPPMIADDRCYRAHRANPYSA
jgi:hypothetical protein